VSIVKKYVSRCKYQVKQQRVVCYVAALRSVLTYVSALVGFLCKMVTPVHGYEQDKEHLCMYTRMYVCVCVVFFFLRFNTVFERTLKGWTRSLTF
jgi:hypothetical protein